MHTCLKNQNVNWEAVFAGFNRFWNHEAIGNRPLIQLQAPAGDRPRREGYNWWTGLYPDSYEQTLEEFRSYATREVRFYAEGYPYLFVNLGPGNLPTFLEIEPQLDNGVWWFEHPHTWEELFERLHYLVIQSVTEPKKHNSKGPTVFVVPGKRLPV